MVDPKGKHLCSTSGIHRKYNLQRLLYGGFLGVAPLCAVAAVKVPWHAPALHLAVKTCTLRLMHPAPGTTLRVADARACKE